MKTFYIYIILAISSNLFSSSEFIKRYAIIVGCNYGDNTTQELEYSVADAANFSNVMVNLGGTEKEDIRLLKNPKLSDLQNSIKMLKSELVKKDSDRERSEVIFYYSGHSNKKGLMLYNEKYLFEDLKNDINSLNSDVKIVILDSCYSGEYTRFKGGVRKPPFIFDTSVETEGKAVLTSSTGKEESQESDLYGSSFFSHALITGLRGAADSNNNKKVTLNEAYQYAFDETLKKTEDKGQITQHPAYDIDLKGTGNLVITDLESQSSKIVFNENFYGIITIRKDSGVLVAELKKRQGEVLELCLDRGKYSINIIKGEKEYTGDLTLGINDRIDSNELKLKSKSPIFSMFKGEGKINGFYPIGYNYINKSKESVFNLSLWSKRFEAVKVANLGLFYTLNSGNSSWYQGAMVANVDSGSINGVQLSGILNKTTNTVKGVQLASINMTDSIKGLQLGVINRSESFSGVQLGLINNTKSGKGVQIGIVNISDDLTGIPIGLIDIQKNGENYYNFWIEGNDNNSFLYSSFRFGSKYLYKQITIGTGRINSNNFINGALGFDLGLRIPLFDNRVSLLNDAGIEYLSNSGLNDYEYYNLIIPKISNKLELKISSRLGIFAGITTRVYIKEFNDNMRGEDSYEYVNPFGTCFLSNRFLAGIEFK